MMWTLPFPRRVVLALLVILIILPLGCKKEAEAPEEEEHAAPVKWETAEKADLEEWTELLGTTQPLPNHVAHISAAVGGYVLAVLPSEKDKPIVEGQRIEKGQILVRLDDRVLRASRQKLVAGDAELQEQTRQSENAVELARIEIERLERLQSKSGNLPLVTRLEMDKARLAYKDAESKQKAALAKEGVAHAEVKMLDEELELYTMRSPIAGQLGIVHARPGQTLSVGTTVAEVIDLDEIDVLCFVPARTVHHLEIDQVVRIEESGEHEEDSTRSEEEGKIVFVSDQAQAETGTVAVKARFPNKKRKLRANTLVRLRVRTEKKAGCMTIPEAALLEDQEEPAVLVVRTEKDEEHEGKEEQKVYRYQVELGLRDRNKHRVEILKLFKVEEEKKQPVKWDKETLFVVEGGHGLEDKDLVTLKKEEEHEEHKDDKKDDEHKEGKKDDEHKEEKKDAK